MSAYSLAQLHQKCKSLARHHWFFFIGRPKSGQMVFDRIELKSLKVRRYYDFFNHNPLTHNFEWLLIRLHHTRGSQLAQVYSG